jgi:hypothetical protein
MSGEPPDRLHILIVYAPADPICADCFPRAYVRVCVRVCFSLSLCMCGRVGVRDVAATRATSQPGLDKAQKLCADLVRTIHEEWSAAQNRTQPYMPGRPTSIRPPPPPPPPPPSGDGANAVMAAAAAAGAAAAAAAAAGMAGQPPPPPGAPPSVPMPPPPPAQAPAVPMDPAWQAYAAAAAAYGGWQGYPQPQAYPMPAPNPYGYYGYGGAYGTYPGYPPPPAAAPTAAPSAPAPAPAPAPAEQDPLTAGMAAGPLGDYAAVPPPAGLVRARRRTRGSRAD